MLDIKFIRQNPELIRKTAADKGIKIDVDAVLVLDEESRRILRELEGERAQQNAASAVVPKDQNEILRLRKIKEDIKLLEEKLGRTGKRLEDQLAKIPNIPTDDTPVGKNELENKVLRQVGKIPKFDFKPKEHWQLGKELGIINTEKAAEVTGSRFSYLKGDLVLIEFALIQHAFSVLVSEKILAKIIKDKKLNIKPVPFVPIVPPVLVRAEVMQKMARLEPREERYYVSADDLYLVGSAEHTLGPLHMGEVLLDSDLPTRYVGFSTSFRREAGSYGKDVKGIFRVHQFDKVEMESFCLPENSIKEQEFFVAIQEYLMQSLNLPYQVVMICTAEMGGPDARQVDIETWMPGQNRYRETHTADLMTDYQARRLNTKLKRSRGILKKEAGAEFVHMNDATVFAIGRTIIAIMENYQTKEGTIRIPKILQGYLGGKKEIIPSRR